MSVDRILTIYGSSQRRLRVNKREDRDFINTKSPGEKREMPGSCCKVCWNLARAAIFCACAAVSLSNNKSLVKKKYDCITSHKG